MIIAGFGFRKNATLGSFQDAFDMACEAVVPDALAAPDDKAMAQVFRLFAEELDLPIKAIPADILVQQSTLTQSEKVLRERNVGSVAEAAALAGAGRHARLLTARQISSDKLATCALAIREAT